MVNRPYLFSSSWCIEPNIKCLSIPLSRLYPKKFIQFSQQPNNHKTRTNQLGQTDSKHTRKDEEEESEREREKKKEKSIQSLSIFLCKMISLQNYLIDSIYIVSIYWEQWSKQREREKKVSSNNCWDELFVLKLAENGKNGIDRKRKRNTSRARERKKRDGKEAASGELTGNKKKENNYQDATLTVDTTIRMRWASLIYLVHGTLSLCPQSRQTALSRSYTIPYPHNLVFNIL